LGGFVLIEVGGNGEVVGRERIIGGRTINLFENKTYVLFSLIVKR
jgi:hypothetical protein